jgi:uncharacterized phiE125 gp8 family phage protein
MSFSSQGPGAVALGDADRAAAVAAIKAGLRVALADDDALIGAFAETALGLAEHFTGRVMITRALTVVLPALCGWQRLGLVPVRSITQVAGLASDGSAVTLPPVDYAIDIDSAGEGWVRIADAGGASRVQVAATAGLADNWASLPAPIREGTVLLASYLYTARDTAQPPPAAVTALWRPWRVLALAPAGHA